MKVEDVIHLVAASCILHNKFELRRDPLLNEWFEQAQDRSYPQPEDGDVPFRMNARERADASDTRNILANFFMTGADSNWKLKYLISSNDCFCMNTLWVLPLFEC